MVIKEGVALFRQVVDTLRFNWTTKIGMSGQFYRNRNFKTGMNLDQFCNERNRAVAYPAAKQKGTFFIACEGVMPITRL
jgi:hypothetical protein